MRGQNQCFDSPFAGLLPAAVCKPLELPNFAEPGSLLPCLWSHLGGIKSCRLEGGSSVATWHLQQNIRRVYDKSSFKPDINLDMHPQADHWQSHLSACIAT